MAQDNSVTPGWKCCVSLYSCHRGRCTQLLCFHPPVELQQQHHEVCLRSSLQGWRWWCQISPWMLHPQPVPLSVSSERLKYSLFSDVENMNQVHLIISQAEKLSPPHQSACRRRSDLLCSHWAGRTGGLQPAGNLCHHQSRYLQSTALHQSRTQTKKQKWHRCNQTWTSCRLKFSTHSARFSAKLDAEQGSALVSWKHVSGNCHKHTACATNSNLKWMQILYPFDRFRLSLYL